MIKSTIAYTNEIDDVKVAVKEILDGLNLSGLKKNRVGIINCFSDYIDSGAYKAICEALPFPTVGITTNAAACKDIAAQTMFTINVLSSDDVFFSAGQTTSLSSEQNAPIKNAYDSALKELNAEPKLVLAFFPLIQHVGGDVILKEISYVSDNLPVFGTMAVDHNIDYSTAYTLYGGGYSKENMSFVIVGGNVQAKFMLESISESKILNQKSIITASSGNLLQEVNNMPIVDYLETLGISKESQVSGANVIPFVVDYNDGTKPAVRAIFATTPQGHAVCGGEMPVNATLSIGTIDYYDVMATSEKMAKAILAEKYECAIIYSCIARFFVQGADFMAEMEKVSSILGGKQIYQACYSGGEICPLSANGKTYNRFHNYTMVACLLK